MNQDDTDPIQVEPPGAGPIMRPVGDDYIDGYVMAPPGAPRPVWIVFVMVMCEPYGFVPCDSETTIAYHLTKSGGLWFKFRAPRAWLLLEQSVQWMTFLVFDQPPPAATQAATRAETLAATASAKDPPNLLVMGRMPEKDLQQLAPRPAQGVAATSPPFRDKTRKPKPALRKLIDRAVRTRPLGELTRGLVDRNWASGAFRERTNEASLTFAVGSCRYPPGLLDRTPSRAPITLARLTTDDDQATPVVGNADAVLWKLLERFTNDCPPSHPRLLLLIGDQIYADATAGLFDPAMLTDGLRSQYRTLFSEGVSRVLFNQFERVHFMLDDHEIVDNWEPHCADRRVADRELKVPLAAFAEAELFGITSGAGPLDRPLSVASRPFLLLDTRTRREWRTAATWTSAQILDDGQWRKLDEWFDGTTAAPVRFIAFPAMLLPRHLSVVRRPESGLREDNWDGYPASRVKLLTMLIEKNAQNTVFLSGDEHLPIVANILMTPVDHEATPIRAYSFHCSAIYAPYPFANSIAAQFVPEDRFEIVVEGKRWTVTTQACFPEVGDNVALFTANDTTLKITFQGVKTTWERTVTLGEPVGPLSPH